MPDDLIVILEESEVMNGALILREHLEILWALSELGEDGATARQTEGRAEPE